MIKTGIKYIKEESNARSFRNYVFCTISFRIDDDLVEDGARMAKMMVLHFSFHSSFGYVGTKAMIKNTIVDDNGKCLISDWGLVKSSAISSIRCSRDFCQENPDFFDANLFPYTKQAVARTLLNRFGDWLDSKSLQVQGSRRRMLRSDYELLSLICKMIRDKEYPSPIMLDYICEHCKDVYSRPASHLKLRWEGFDSALSEFISDDWKKVYQSMSSRSGKGWHFVSNSTTEEDNPIHKLRKKLRGIYG